MDKTNTEDDSNPKNGSLTVRDSLVSTAVQFLQNPNLSSSPLNMKKEFLKKKGLTDEEIEVAVQRSGVNNSYQPAPPVRYNDQILPPPVSYYPHQMALVQSVPSRLLWLRDLANSIVAIGGAAYVIFWFYKKYIQPYLFGRKKKEIKKDPVEVELVKLKETVERVNNNFERLEQKVEFSSQRIQVEDQELIMHITSLKGLLLNRKQFPATPVTTAPSTGPASIPSWQLSEGQPPSSEDKKLENSPSNSSNNSTNNDGTSDSSLEVIKDQEIINSK